MRAACLQLRTGLNMAVNIDEVCRRTRDAVNAGAECVITPEMTHYLDQKSSRLFENIFCEDDDPGIKAFSELAGNLGIHLIIGSLAIRIADDRAANRMYVFGPQGDVAATYDKIHMFDADISESVSFKESRTYAPGDRAITAGLGAMHAGLSICYDLRFPSLYRHYAQSGAEMIVVPAAFTRPTGEAHWETLLRARAIETGAYICAPAQGGAHEDGRETWGRSMIIDPWGEIIAQLDHDEPGMIMADIDPAKATSTRRRIPSLTHDREFAR